MKKLIFNITFSNHTFQIQANYLKTLCLLEVKDKYTASLKFAANIYANISYKNIKFSGTVTKRDSWTISLDMNKIIRKKNNKYYFESTNIKSNEDKIRLSGEIITDYPKNILNLYNQIINDVYEQYSYIEDKEKFQYQLCEYLIDNYCDIENIDQIIEYENYTGVADDGDPVVEQSMIRNVLLNKCKDFISSFCQAELDNKQKESIVTLENVIDVMPELKKVPYEFLCQEYNKYLVENYEDLIEPDIYYNVLDVLGTIGKKLYDSYQYLIFTSTLETKIEKIIFDKKAYNINKDEVLYFCKTKYRELNVPDDIELKQSVEKFIDDNLAFDELYNKFNSLFNSDCIELKWDEQKLQLFEKYDKKEMTVVPQHSAEYEVYRYIIPYYKKHLYRKNSKKYKPIIEQFPAFISYASFVIDILFKYNILIDKKERVIYNEFGDIDSAYKELEKYQNQEI